MDTDIKTDSSESSSDEMVFEDLANVIAQAELNYNAEEVAQQTESVVNASNTFTVNVLKDSKAKEIIVYCLPAHKARSTVLREEFSTVLLSLPTSSPARTNQPFITSLSHDTFRKLVLAIGPQYIEAFQDVQLVNGSFVSYCLISLKLETLNAAYKAAYNCGKEFVSVDDRTQLKRSLFDAVRITDFVFMTGLKYANKIVALKDMERTVGSAARDSGMPKASDLASYAYFNYLEVLAEG